MRKGTKYTHVEDEFENQLTDFAEAFYENSEDSYSEALKEELKKAIFSLKPHYKAIIIAVDIEGYTYRELSEETGVPEGTLLSRRHRAVSLLFKALAQKKKL